MGWFDVTWDQCGQWRAEMNGTLRYLEDERKLLWAEVVRLRAKVEGDATDWGLWKEVHGTEQPGQEGLKRVLTKVCNDNEHLARRLETLERENAELRGELQKLPKLIAKAVNECLGTKTIK